MAITEQTIEELIKSHKYSRKEFKNGTWYYYYDKHNNFGRIAQCKSSALTFQINRNLSEKDQCKQVEKQATDYISNVWLKDWQKTTPDDKSICMELRNKKVVFEGISYKHISEQGKNSKGGRQGRTLRNMLDHSKYLPCAKEMLESSGVWTNARYEVVKKPYTDKTGKKVIGHVYQSVTGEAPKGDKSNNYVQATVSKIKYADNSYGNTVYISVMGMKNIKKSTELEPCLFIRKSEVKEIYSFGSFGNWQPYTSNITHNYNLVNKNIEIDITDITEGNRFKKFEQFEKCLAGKTTEYIPADNTRRLPTVNIKLKDFSHERIEKALRTMAMSFAVPLKAAKGEIFFYKAQEDLTDKWCMFFSELVRNTYDYVTDYLDLPKKTVMSKAVLTHKGKILYYPETGEPIKQADWKNFISNLEKFLNRSISNPAEKIILQSQALGKILDRMLKYNTLEAVKKIRLNEITYHGKSFDWISDSVKNMKNVLGESLARQEMARIETLQQSAAMKVTNVTSKVRGDIQQILIDGVRGKKSKGQVSQDLFDKMVGDNRDYQRLADTEIQNAFNNSVIREEVQNTPEGHKTYFQRVEVIDGNTCPFCRQMNGKIAVWSDKPLKDDKAHEKGVDFVLWEGKEWNGKEHGVTTGVFHPFCRGYWAPYDVGGVNIDAMVAELSKKSEKWNNAVKQAENEFKEKGIKTPDDSTKGFTDRINELFRSEDIQKSLSINEKLFNLWTRRLSPEFAEEYKKLHDQGRVIPRKIYAIKGYPKGQDLENCILLELGEDFFVISCFGDWQDEKLVKIMLTKNGFVAKVITTAAKEDKRLLKKKTNYIFGKIDKSLTYSGHKLQGRTTFQGMNISIENKKGSIRRGTDSDGHKWAIKMHYDYGYIRGTEGADGDHVDCYLGGNEGAKKVYIIHQKIPGTDKYDEDKCMLGFDTLEEAKAAYLKQYDKPGFFGGIDTVAVEVFKEKVLLKKWHGKRLDL